MLRQGLAAVAEAEAGSRAQEAAGAQGGQGQRGAGQCKASAGGEPSAEEGQAGGEEGAAGVDSVEAGETNQYVLTILDFDSFFLSLPMSSPFTEISLATRSGVSLAARLYGVDARVPTPVRLLCIHGWMDNAASFAALAEHLMPALPPTASLLALDLCGHGLSSHLPGGFYTLSQHAALVAEALELLDWQHCTLLCHSMGGAVGMLLAGAFPERCRGLVLLDSAGPISRPARDAPDALRAFTAAKAQLAARPGGSTYASLEDAVRARLQTVASYPGAQTLSQQAAHSLVQRMLVRRPEGGGWGWAFDPLIKLHSVTGTPDEVVLEHCARLAAASLPVLLLRASKGWPYPQQAMQARLAAMAATLQVVPGGHHAHADPDTAPGVAAAVLAWLSSKGLLA